MTPALRRRFRPLRALTPHGWYLLAAAALVAGVLAHLSMEALP